MKKTKKRIIASLLVAVIILAAVPFNNFSNIEFTNLFFINSKAEENTLESTGQCGENVYWTFDEVTGLLIISGTGEMYEYDYAWIEAPFCNNTLIKNVIIENGVTYLGECTFANCINLTNISIPNSITSISVDTFSGCSSLTSVFIPDSVTSIGECAFLDCKKLTKVTIENSNIRIDYCAFMGCTGLKELVIPCSAKIVNDSSVFYDCTNIEKLTLTKGSGEMQNYDAGTSYYATNTCYQYTPWYISRNSIKEIIIENGVKKIGDYAFYGCSYLTGITIPDSVTSIGNYAFNGQTLFFITENSYIEQYLDNKGYNYIFNKVIPENESTFYNKITNKLSWTIDTISETLTINCNGKMPSFADDAAPWIPYCKYIKHTIISDGCTQISENAFKCCIYMKSLIIPDGIISINDYAFYFCSALSSVMIPDSVTNVGNNAFECCNLEYVQMGNGLTYIPDTLINKDSLKSFIIGENVANINSNTFSGCTGLSSIIIPDSVCSIGSQAFSGCTGLTNVIIGNGVTSINNNVFSNCHLENVQIGNGLTYIPSCLINKDYLKTFIIGSNVSCISDLAFNGCSKLENITIPQSVKNIGNKAFTGCTTLDKIKVYSRDCIFADDATAYYTTIYGYENSTAESYANENGFAFEYIDENDHEHTYINSCDATCEICGYERTELEHTYSYPCDIDCDICGAVREDLTHTFSDDCDEACNYCDYIRDVSHFDMNNDGYCDNCGKFLLIYGDLNCDGTINSYDALMILQISVDIITEYNSEIADLNADGYIDSLDALLVLQYCVDIIDEFPVISKSELLSLYTNAVNKAWSELPEYRYNSAINNFDANVDVHDSFGLLNLSGITAKELEQEAENEILSQNDSQQMLCEKESNYSLDNLPVKCSLTDASLLKQISYKTLENGNIKLDMQFYDEVNPKTNSAINKVLGFATYDDFYTELVNSVKTEEIEMNITVNLGSLKYKNGFVSCEINPATYELSNIEYYMVMDIYETISSIIDETISYSTEYHTVYSDFVY